MQIRAVLMRFRVFFVVLLIMSHASVVRAEIRISELLGDLIYEADAILVVEFDPDHAQKHNATDWPLKVTHIIHGNGYQVGDHVSLEPSGVRNDRGSFQPQGQRSTYTLKQAVVFMKRDGHDFRWIDSGMRVMRDDGKVLLPIQMRNPGPLLLTEIKDLTWNALIEDIQRKLTWVKEIKKIQTIKDTDERVPRILDWIAKHQDHITTPWNWTKPDMFGNLPYDLFSQIYQTGEPDHALAAMRLQMRLDYRDPRYDVFLSRTVSYDLPWQPSDDPEAVKFYQPRGFSIDYVQAFKSPEAIDHLLQVLTHELTTLEDRALAIWALGAATNNTNGKPEWREDQTRRIIESLKSYMTDEYQILWYAASVTMISHALLSEDEQTYKLACEIMEAFWHKRLSLRLRHALVPVLFKLLPSDRWQKLTGNAPKALVTIRTDHSYGQDHLQVHLGISPAVMNEYQKPELLIYPVDQNGKINGKPIKPIEHEKHLVGNEPPEQTGDHLDHGYLRYLLKLQGIKAGEYVIIANGKVHDDGKFIGKYQSIPFPFKVNDIDESEARNEQTTP